MLKPADKTVECSLEKGILRELQERLEFLSGKLRTLRNKEGKLRDSYSYSYSKRFSPVRFSIYNKIEDKINKKISLNDTELFYKEEMDEMKLIEHNLKSICYLKEKYVSEYAYCLDRLILLKYGQLVLPFY